MIVRSIIQGKRNDKQEIIVLPQAPLQPSTVHLSLAFRFVIKNVLDTIQKPLQLFRNHCSDSESDLEMIQEHQRTRDWGR